MCGIAGILDSTAKRPPQNDELIAMQCALRHRGPDGDGHWISPQGNIGLAHVRLAIIDLSAKAAQPMTDGLDKVWITFNGEIYNHASLRKMLEEVGRLFVTDHSDTEVLIHALCQWGENALDKLEGMWAFAWYNEKDGSLLLSRDRFGEKPLYIWQNDEGFYFSSEVKGLAALAGEWPQINEHQLLRSLTNGYKSLYKTKETFFLKVKELSAGTFFKINSKGIGYTKQYWKNR